MIQKITILALLCLVSGWGANADQKPIATGVIQYQAGNYSNVSRNSSAMAAVKSDGTVVAWGNPDYGGDYSSVSNQLTNVVRVFDGRKAFAALRADGTVVTWGNQEDGGDSSAVSNQLYDISAIYANWGGAFAAVRSNGTVVTWGHSSPTDYGADSSSVSNDLHSVDRIYANFFAFAAVKTDGKVVTWGRGSSGGDSSSVSNRLTNVVHMVSASTRFAALRADRTVVIWPNSGNYGTDGQFTNVSVLRYGGGAFAALRDDGSVVVWGSTNSNSGGDISAVSSQLHDVASLFANGPAFAALHTNGTVVTWGHAERGGDSSSVADQLTNVVTITGSSQAFAATRADGSVVTWGVTDRGGDSSAVADQLVGVTNVLAAVNSFAAQRTDGSIVTWGGMDIGGGSSLQQKFSLVVANGSSFAALREDGAVVTWGYSGTGGDSSSVSDLLQSGVTGFAGPDFTTFPGDVILDRSLQVRADTALSMRLGGIDPDGGLLTYTIVTPPIHGTLTGTLPTLNYQPVAGFSGADAFTYKVSNGTLDSIPITIGINVNSSPELALLPIAAQTTTEDTPLAITAQTSGDSFDDLTLTISSSDTNVIAVVVTNSVAFSFTTNWYGTARITVFATARVGSSYAHDSETFDLTVTPVNDAPIPNGLFHQFRLISTPSIRLGYDRSSSRQMNHRSFVAVKKSGDVITWGGASSGGDSSAVSGQLTNVRSVTSTWTAFAALRQDGSVVTWGNSDDGGDSSSVSTLLTTNVTAISSTGYEFAALKRNGTVVSWGRYGATVDQVASQLNNVIRIYSTWEGSFAALKTDGTVAVWGRPGISTASVSDVLTNIADIRSTSFAFAALRTNGTVVTWGNFAGQKYGGDSSAVSTELFNIQEIYATWYAFAARRTDGRLFTWGRPEAGGDSSSVISLLTNVVDVAGTDEAFAALRADGSVVTWGSQFGGGDSGSIASELTNIVSVASSRRAFAGLRSDGSVISWGYALSSGAISRRLQSVRALQSNEGAFAAVHSNGTVTAWGEPGSGGDSSAVATQLTNVISIAPARAAFAALRADGSVVAWGSQGGGGDSSAVSNALSSDVAFVANPFSDDHLVSTNDSRLNVDEDSSITARLSGFDVEGDMLTFSIVTPPTNGLLTGTLPDLIYSPNANYNGPDAFAYKLSDGVIDSPAKTVAVVVAQVNDPPVLTSIHDQQVAEDFNLTLALQVDDSDTGTVFTFTAAVSTPNVTASINGNQLTLTPARDWHGTAVVTVTVIDDSSAANDRSNRSFTLTVLPVNDSPVITPIGPQTFAEDTTQVISVAAFDPDSTGPFGYTASSSDTNLVARFTDSQLVLVGGANWHGSANVSISVDDQSGATNSIGSIDIAVTVTPVNDPPVLPPLLNRTILEDTALTLTLAGSDIDGTDTLSYGAIIAANTVSAQVNGNQITLTPAANWNGSTRVAVVVDDNSGALNARFTNSFTLTVTPVNDAPVIQLIFDSVVAEDNQLLISLQATDADGDSVSFQATSIETVILQVEGSSLRASFQTNWNGAAGITVMADDNSGTTNATTSTSFTVVVTPENDLPILSWIGDRSTAEDTPLHLNLSALDPDFDTPVFSASPHINNLVVGLTNGLLTVTPFGNWHGSGMITVAVTDASGQTNSASSETFTVSVLPVNDPPLLHSILAQTILEDTVARVNLLAVDVDGDAVTFGATPDGTNLSVSLIEGLLSIIPRTNWSGTGTVTYSATDNSGTTNATVSRQFPVTVLPVNDQPVLLATNVPGSFGASPYRTNMSDSSSISLSLAGLFHDSDPQDVLSLQLAGLPEGLSFAPQTGHLSGILEASASQGGPNSDGRYPLLLTATDGNGETGNLMFTIAVTNPLPTAVNDFASGNEDTVFSIAVLTNDTDVDGDSISLFLVGSPSHGSASIISNSVSYVPQANFHGPDVVSYMVSDADGGTATGTVMLEVRPVNDFPVLATIGAIFTTDGVPISRALTVSDPDLSDSHSFSASSSDTNIVVTIATERMTISPRSGWHGTAAVTVVVQDSSSATNNSDTELVSVTVAPVFPSFRRHPSSGLIDVGGDYQFETEVVGTPPIALQWFKGGTAISDATNSVFVIQNATTNDAGRYRVAASNLVSGVSSGEAVLAVNRLNQTVQFGAPSMVHEGEALGLTGNASSGLPVRFSVFNTNRAVIRDNRLIVLRPGNVSIEANQDGDSSHLPAQAVTRNVQILPPLPVLTVQPTNTSVAAGNSGALVVEAFQSRFVSLLNNAVWPTNHTVRPGQVVTWVNRDDSPQTITSTVGLWNSGALQRDDSFSFVFANPGTYHYFSALNPGVTGTITVTNSIAELGYQWFKEGFGLPGANQKHFTVVNISSALSGRYYAKVSGIGGEIKSAEAILRVMTPQRLELPMPNGTADIRIRFRNEDGFGRPFDIVGLRLLIADELKGNQTIWITNSSGFTITTNGFIQIDDSAVQQKRQRFYRVLER